MDVVKNLTSLSENNSPKFSIAFAAANLMQSQPATPRSLTDSPGSSSPHISPPMVSNVQGHGSLTDKGPSTPSQPRMIDSVTSEDSTTPSPHQFTSSYPHYGTDLSRPLQPLGHESLGSPISRKLHKPTDMSNGSHQSHSPTTDPNTTRLMDQYGLQKFLPMFPYPRTSVTGQLPDPPTSLRSIDSSIPHSTSNLAWPANMDTGTALATLSYAYSSLIREAQLNPALRPTMNGSMTPLRPNLGLPPIGLRPSSEGLSSLGRSQLSRPVLPTMTNSGHNSAMGKTGNLAKSQSMFGVDKLPEMFTSGGLIPDNVGSWHQLQQAIYANNLDPQLLALYKSAGCNFELSGTSRRKNATRETTSMLKAWLNEHRKNPYPTKGEKIMLAIVTKMSLTQVSTWFANARRRLKKENKMTWSARHASSEVGQGEDDSIDGDAELDGDLDDDDDEGEEMSESNAFNINGIGKSFGLNNKTNGGFNPSVKSRSQTTTFNNPDVLSSYSHALSVSVNNSLNRETKMRPSHPDYSEAERRMNGEPMQKRCAREIDTRVPDPNATSDSDRHRKIWSLVELAQEHMERDANRKPVPEEGLSNSNPLMNYPTHKPSSIPNLANLPENWLALLSRLHGGDAGTIPPKGLTASTPQPKGATATHPLAWGATNLQRCFKTDSTAPLNSVDTPSIPPSPAALAAFYYYYQQQQQQQQQLMAQGHLAHATHSASKSPHDPATFQNLPNPLDNRGEATFGFHPAWSIPMNQVTSNRPHTDV